METSITLEENETYVIFNKDSAVVIFEPVDETKVDSKLILPTEMTNENLLSSNIAIALLQKIKADRSFINNLLNWFHAKGTDENCTIH
jgi:hypothetical protein